jgi:hypothetical protein
VTDTAIPLPLFGADERASADPAPHGGAFEVNAAASVPLPGGRHLEIDHSVVHPASVEVSRRGLSGSKIEHHLNRACRLQPNGCHLLV